MKTRYRQIIKKYIIDNFTIADGFKYKYICYGKVNLLAFKIIGNTLEYVIFLSLIKKFSLKRIFFLHAIENILQKFEPNKKIIRVNQYWY